MATEIREATDFDIDAIVNIHNASARRAYRELLPPEYLDSDELLDKQRGNWTQRLTHPEPGYSTRVAEVDKKIAGFIAYQQHGNKTVELSTLYVAPSHWSTGIGSALQRDAIGIWRVDGLADAYLWTPIDNPRAHRSYKKNNWVITEETRTEDFDGHKVVEQKLILELNS